MTTMSAQVSIQDHMPNRDEVLIVAGQASASGLGLPTNAIARTQADAAWTPGIPDLAPRQPLLELQRVPNWKVAASENDAFTRSSNQRAVAGSLRMNRSFLALWVDAIGRVAELSDLPDNWDSYGGVGLSDEARLAALTFVVQLLGYDIPDALAEVDILPTPTGGIQFEWSGIGGDLEVEIDRDGNFHSLIEWPDGDSEESAQESPLSWPQVRHQLLSVLR